MDQPKRSKSNWKPILLLLATACGIGYWLVSTGPTTTPEDEKRQPKAVKTLKVMPGTYEVSIRAYGTVIPSQRIVVEPEVPGQITRLHSELVPGGTVQSGDELFAIDQTITELRLQESSADLERIDATLKEAERKRDETKQLLADNLVSETELAAQEANVRIEQAGRNKLEATMARTKELLRKHSVKAPFNALVVDEYVDIGQRVDTGFNAATLVGTDTFWVQASVPIDQLRWINLPSKSQKGASAKIYLDTGSALGQARQGNVTQLKGDIQPEGRMARLLISVENPLQSNDQNTPLLLGSYVRVQIAAGNLQNTFKLKRTALRDGDRVWIVDEQDQLQIRSVNLRWTEGDTVYIDKGLEPGDSVIVSPLRIALPGMKVRPQPVDAPTDSVTEQSSNKTKAARTSVTPI